MYFFNLKSDAHQSGRTALLSLPFTDRQSTDEHNLTQVSIKPQKLQEQQVREGWQGFFWSSRYGSINTSRYFVYYRKYIGNTNPLFLSIKRYHNTNGFTHDNTKPMKKYSNFFQRGIKYDLIHVIRAY